MAHLSYTPDSLCQFLQILPIRTSSAHPRKHTVRPTDQHTGGIELENLTMTQDENTVIVNNGAQSVSNCDDGCIAELLADGALNLRGPISAPANRAM